ncbi:glycosyltransferase family 2 protein [Photobacterium damselae]|uniref:glycosyltransferase family 2 protein n=1 Tax=Photobacterium damselae TaxID=38293 RepID=UPI004067C3DB
MISIILPVYNSKSFIDDTINSVINQTYIFWELILVDDRSTDGTFDYIKDKYSNNDKIRIYQNDKNSGAGFTRNKGISEAKYSYIAFIDADDIWLPDKLSIQIEYMKKNNYPIVHTSYSFIDSENKKISGSVIASKKVTLDSYMKNTEIGMSTSLINRDVVGDFKLDLIRTRQDTKLWLNLLGKGFNSYGIEEKLVKYRIRNGQISANKFKVAYMTFKVFMSVTSIPLYRKLYNYSFYAFNGVVKRFRI